MTRSRERALIDRILAKHGARPDLRLWRNETALTWVGKRKRTTKTGDTVLHRGARRMSAGLKKGSADLIGIRQGGQFVALEVKTEGVRTSDTQKRWLAVIRDLGGLAAVVRSVEDVDEVLGEPPPQKKEGP